MERVPQMSVSSFTLCNYDWRACWKSLWFLEENNHRAEQKYCWYKKLWWVNDFDLIHKYRCSNTSVLFFPRYCQKDVRMFNSIFPRESARSVPVIFHHDVAEVAVPPFNQLKGRRDRCDKWREAFTAKSERPIRINTHGGVWHFLCLLSQIVWI